MVAHFRVRLDSAQSNTGGIPALALLLYEQRSGGWNGAVQVNPRVVDAEQAFQTLIADEFAPGAAVGVKLVLGDDTPLAGAPVRIWPSVLTSAATVASVDPESPDALCVLSFRDPLSYLRRRPIWATFAHCSPAEMLGGALSAAAGVDDKPTVNPALPGLPVVRIRQQLREAIRRLPYAIATGEPLGYWLNRICSRLGVRIEMWGDMSGEIVVNLVDAEPAESGMNTDGGVTMTFDQRQQASATNLSIARIGTNAAAFPSRGGLLDSLGSGTRRFGTGGAVADVVGAAQTSAEEAEARAGFRQSSRRLAEVQVSMISGQPGLLPGRVVNLDGTSGGYESMFGASAWQVADIAHLCIKARYWNRPEFEKLGAAWRPASPPREGATIVSGVVDDGESPPGAEIERDHLGRIPIKFPFVVDWPEEGSGTDGGAPAGALPPSVWLAPVAPLAGSRHGFVSTHRQGDWCRVSVLSPLQAEVAGFCHRDDRYLSAGVRDSTMGIVMREKQGDWRGLIFRPDEDLEDEIPDS